jgi:hypothetical protein
LYVVISALSSEGFAVTLPRVVAWIGRERPIACHTRGLCETHELDRHRVAERDVRLVETDDLGDEMDAAYRAEYQRDSRIRPARSECEEEVARCRAA